MRSFEKNLTKFTEAGIRIVGISVDTPEETREYMIQKAGYPFTFLSDPKLETILRYDLVHAHEIASGKDIARPAEFLIDPSGKMTWKESVAPLDRTLTRFGNSTTPAPVKFSVDQVIVGVDPAEYSAVSDFFAAAQFEELTDAEKLSRASFERMQAGVEVASASVRAGPSISAPLTYETEYRDPEHGPRDPTGRSA